MYSKNRKIIYFYILYGPLYKLYYLIFNRWNTICNFIFFTKEKSTIIASIIPAFPVVFITGYLYLLYFKGNVETYSRNTICTFSLHVIFMILLYLLILYVQDVYILLFVALFIYVISLYFLVQYKILS